MRTLVGERLQAATGLIFVLLSLIALFALPPRPAAGASAKEIASYYTVHNGAAQAVDYIVLLALLFARGSLATFVRSLREPRGRPTTSRHSSLARGWQP